MIFKPDHENYRRTQSRGERRGVKKIIRDQRFGTGLGRDSRIRSGYTRGGGWRTPAGIVPFSN